MSQFDADIRGAIDSRLARSSETGIYSTYSIVERRVDADEEPL